MDRIFDYQSSSGLAAFDDLQRPIIPENYPPYRPDRKVGMFYFIWHDHKEGEPLVDHTADFELGGIERVKENVFLPRMGYLQYWAEPYFGYYRSDDPWVIRRHGTMLTMAGVDFIFIDITNALTYRETYETIFRVWGEMRKTGIRTPDIMFITNTRGADTVLKIYNDLYKPGLYKDQWFMYGGKPLILVPKAEYEQLPEEVRDFFTVRYSWAYTKGASGEWYTSEEGRNCWPWADMYPQSVGLDPEGKPEQMIVMCGFWVNGSYGTNAGRSYSGGVQPDNLIPGDLGFGLSQTSAGEGRAFQEQFDRALSEDTRILMITGWNEWTAGRWGSYPGTTNNPAIGQTIANSYTVVPGGGYNDCYFVDNFNGEFSRDLEPVKGLFGDNYYLQLSDLVRKYKGTVPSEPVNSCFRPVFGQSDRDGWAEIRPEFTDVSGDTSHRDGRSNGGNIRYINESGRNDIVSMKICSDDRFIYFACFTKKPVTAPQGDNWMNLFINSDCNYQNGWHGYDYVLNRHQSGGNASIEVFLNDSWEFEQIGEARMYIEGNMLELAVPRGLVRVKDVFDFKWADNSCDDGDIMKFYDLGDAAPDGRFNYRVKLK